MDNHKIVTTSEEAWNIQEKFKDQPHGWIQWKGTDVCMDVHCKCGHHSHIDDDFVYYIECPNCGTIYMVNGHVEFIEVTQPDEKKVVIRKPQITS